MKAISRIFTVTAVLGIITAISFTLNGANPHLLSFLPSAVTDFMTEYSWLTWVGTGVAVVSVLTRLAVQGAIARSEESR